MAVITFIGSGQMASAITFPAFENGNEVRLVGSPLDGNIIDTLRKDNYHPNLQHTLYDGIKYYKIDEVHEALNETDLVICGVSSFGVDWWANDILPILDENIPTMSVTKGLICQGDGNMICYPQYWANHLPSASKLQLYAIGGPCEAKCLASHVHSSVAYGGPDIKTLEWIRSLLATDYYHIALTTDLIGLEVSVAIKNAYALATSLSYGLADVDKRDGINHWNMESALFMQSTKEMRQLLKILAGSDDMLMYSVGDCHVTSQGGRSRLIGTLLGSGYTIDRALEELKGQTLEAVVISKRLAQAIIEQGCQKEFPLLMHVYDLLEGKTTVNIPWNEFS